MVRESGVKDTIAQPILECLTQIGNELQATQNTNQVTVQAVLAEELKQLKVQGPIRNPLLDMNGLSSYFLSIYLINSFVIRT